MKLTAAAIFFILGVIVGCSSESEDTSAASTRCEDSATYLAAASATAHGYALVVADVLAFTVLRPGQVAELAGFHSDYVSDSADLLNDLRRTADFDAYHAELTATGREVTRGLELLSKGRADEGASVLANLFENLDIAESLPDWVFECGIHG